MIFNEPHEVPGPSSRSRYVHLPYRFNHNPGLPFLYTSYCAPQEVPYPSYTLVVMVPLYPILHIRLQFSSTHLLQFQALTINPKPAPPKYLASRVNPWPRPRQPLRTLRWRWLSKSMFLASLYIDIGLYI